MQRTKFLSSLAGLPLLGLLFKKSNPEHIYTIRLEETPQFKELLLKERQIWIECGEQSQRYTSQLVIREALENWEKGKQHVEKHVSNNEYPPDYYMQAVGDRIMARLMDYFFRYKI